MEFYGGWNTPIPTLYTFSFPFTLSLLFPYLSIPISPYHTYLPLLYLSIPFTTFPYLSIPIYTYLYLTHTFISHFYPFYTKSNISYIILNYTHLFSITNSLTTSRLHYTHSPNYKPKITNTSIHHYKSIYLLINQLYFDLHENQFSIRHK